jgi:hypothetical protein
MHTTSNQLHALVMLRQNRNTHGNAAMIPGRPQHAQILTTDTLVGTTPACSFKYCCCCGRQQCCLRQHVPLPNQMHNAVAAGHALLRSAGALPMLLPRMLMLLYGSNVLATAVVAACEHPKLCWSPVQTAAD